MNSARLWYSLIPSCMKCFYGRLSPSQLSNHQWISTATAVRSNKYLERPLEDFKVAKLSSRSLIKLTGPDVSPFLQGLITNDMLCLENSCESLYAMILNLKGRVVCDIIVYNYPQEFKDTKLVEVAASQSELLLKLLKKYKIRKKVKIELLSDDISVYSAVGCVKETPQDGSTYAVYKDPRLADLGHRLIGTGDVNELGCEILDEEVYRLHRYRLGVGEGPLEHIPEKALPLECNLLQLNGVSFSKGCYIGQELTARSHHTGVIRKRIMPIQTENYCELSDNAELKSISTDKTAGHLRGFAGERGVALLRLSNVLKSGGLYVRDTAGNRVEVNAERPHWWPDNLVVE